MNARISQFLRYRYNIKIASDGGVRGDRVSATGWVVYAAEVDGEGREGRYKIL